jgi:hypothetical protein
VRHHRDALPREYFVIGSRALARARNVFRGHGDGRGRSGSGGQACWNENWLGGSALPLSRLLGADIGADIMRGACG